MTGYLRKTKEVAKLRVGCSWLLSLFTWGFLWEGQRYHKIWARVRGWVQLLAFSWAPGIWRGNRLQSLWEEFATTAAFWFSAAFSYHERSSARMSGWCTGTLLTPDLTEGPFTIYPGARGEIPGSPSSFPLQVSLSWPCRGVGQPPPSPAVLLPQLWVFCYCSHAPLPAGTAQSSSYSCGVADTSRLPFQDFAGPCRSSLLLPGSCRSPGLTAEGERRLGLGLSSGCCCLFALLFIHILVKNCYSFSNIFAWKPPNFKFTKIRREGGHNLHSKGASHFPWQTPIFQTKTVSSYTGTKKKTPYFLHGDIRLGGSSYLAAFSFLYSPRYQM